jgi:prepilin-type processing-associated H-X9-DG protein
MGKFSAYRTPLGTIFPQYFKIPLFEFVSNICSSYGKLLMRNMDEDGEAAAEREVVAEQNDEVVVEATEEEQRQANHRYKNDGQHANQANLAMADGNIFLNDKAPEMLVVLRMNQNFMVFMRENNFPEIKALQPYNAAVVVPDIGEAEGGS